MRNIFMAVKNAANSYQDVQFILPLHPNPKIRELASTALGDSPNVFVIEALPYREFIFFMQLA